MEKGFLALEQGLKVTPWRAQAAFCSHFWLRVAELLNLLGRRGNWNNNLKDSMRLQHNTREFGKWSGRPPAIIWSLAYSDKHRNASSAHTRKNTLALRQKGVGGKRGEAPQKGFSDVYRHVWSKVSPVGECLPSSASIHSWTFTPAQLSPSSHPLTWAGSRGSRSPTAARKAAFQSHFIKHSPDFTPWQKLHPYVANITPMNSLGLSFGFNVLTTQNCIWMFSKR